MLAVRNGAARSSSAQNCRHLGLSLAYSPAGGAGNSGPPNHLLDSLEGRKRLSRYVNARHRRHLRRMFLRRHNVKTASYRSRSVVPWHCIPRWRAQGRRWRPPYLQPQLLRLLPPQAAVVVHQTGSRPYPRGGASAASTLVHYEP